MPACSCCTGAGGISFCAGADLKEIDTLGPGLMDPSGRSAFTRDTSPKPTIAAIEGWCLAGGLELHPLVRPLDRHGSSNLGFPERRWGVPLIDGETQRLPRS